MKCVSEIATKHITRVTDDHARALVASGKYVYAKKQDWKKQVRK